MEPTINDDSLVVVDLQDIDPKKKKIYAFWQDDEGITVKRLIDNIDRYYLIAADNPNEPGYPKLIRHKEKGHDTIRGRIVWTWNVL